MKAIEPATVTLEAFFTEAGAMVSWAASRVAWAGRSVSINLGTNVYSSAKAFTRAFLAVPWWLVISAITFAFIVSWFQASIPRPSGPSHPVQALRTSNWIMPRPYESFRYLLLHA